MMVGEVVVLKNCAYSGCVGAVVGEVSNPSTGASYLVQVPELGQVVRMGHDLERVTDADLAAGVTFKTPTQWLLERDIAAFTAALRAAVAAGNGGAAEAYADAIVDREGRLRACLQQ